jgi:hypothetical protein
MPEVASEEEFLGVDQKISISGWAPQAARNGCVLRLNMKNADTPEVLAIVPLPTAEERRRREVMLARVMLVAIDLVLSGEGLGPVTARDLVRKVRHACPEVVDEFVRPVNAQ